MKSRIGLILFFLLMAGCSTIRVSNDYNPDYDFTVLKAFNVLPGRAPDNLTRDRIIKALTQELEAKGYRRTPRNRADFYVVFHTNVTRKRQIVTDYRRIGVPYHCYGPRNAYRHGYGTAVVPVYREVNYKEGKIVVDILDAKTKKIFWRGIVTDRLKAQKTPEERWEYIKEVVQKLLAPFPARNRPARKTQE